MRRSERPSRLVRSLIRILVPRKERDFFLGDLDELFRRAREEAAAGAGGGRRSALRELLGVLQLRFDLSENSSPRRPTQEGTMVADLMQDEMREALHQNGMIHGRCFAAVLFDMDGVLVDSSSVVHRTWQRWAARHGLEAAPVLRVSQGRRTEETLGIVAPHVDLQAEVEWLTAAELRDSDGVIAIPGACELVSNLPENRWAVVTSANRELALRRLAWAGLPRPLHLISSERVARGKPAPDGYVQAATVLGVEPRDCLVFEDSPPGLLAAKNAGMPVIALTTTHPPNELVQPDLFVSDLTRVRAEVRGARIFVAVEE